MPLDRWKRIEALFETALDRPAEDRDSWLREACSNDAELLHEVEQLLRAHEKAEGILEKPVHAMATDLISASPVEDHTVGPYRLVKEIGRGGMGVVYQAHDPRLERFVALKLLPCHLRAKAQIESRFIDEAKAASALDHPNICTIYDVGEAKEGELYITMAYYEGRMLSRKIEEGPLPLEDSLDIASQIAAGLECAHDAGIVHRDIKPSNIAQTKRGEVKILDFGVAKLERVESTTKPGMMIGTTAYMSPEQARGKNVDHRTDLWSLGIVLYEMLAGRRPFGGESEVAVLQAILNESPVPIRTVRPDLPKSIADFLDGLLEKSPTKRFGNAALVRDQLEILKKTPASFTRLPTPLGNRAEGNLPVQLTSFVGREDESRKIRALLAKTRLVTLTGPAGTGKTRLGLRAAEEVAEQFQDGAFFVTLSSIAEPDRVPSAIAQVLGVPESRVEAPLDTLVKAVRDKNLLLVLDNFEHVAVAARAVSTLLETCPDVRFLVTSRVPLRLSGEHEFPVSPLALPGPEAESDPVALRRFPAVQLFVDRAQAVVSEFRLNDDTAGSVAELCIRLDGLPLAIELAAARTKLFSPQAMLTRLGKRLDLLKGGPRDRPARHQTLRQAIAWSYDLLNDEQQSFFRRLAVFVGSFSIEAAEEIASADVDAVDGLETLVVQSLLRSHQTQEGEPRFELLETIQDFAGEKLEQAGELDDTERAHARHYLDLAERSEPTLTGPDQARWLERLDKDRDNLRAALFRAVDKEQVETGLRLGAALWRFWLIRGHYTDEKQHLERLLASPKAEMRTKWRAMALHGVGTLAHNQGDNLKARAFLEESLSIWRELDDKKGTAAELNNLGWVACELNDVATAQALSEEGLALNRELGEKRGIAVAHNNLGWLAAYRGDYEGARANHEKSLAFRREIGDQRGVAFALTNLAWAEHNHGDYERGLEFLEQALGIIEEVGDKVLLPWALNVRGMVHQERGDHARAVSDIEACMSLWPEGGNRSLIAWARSALGSLMHDKNDDEKAWELLNKSLSDWKAIGSPWGQAMALNQLGIVAHAGRDVDRARSFLEESMKLRRNIGDERGLAESFESLAKLLIDEGESGRATRLFSKAASLRVATQNPLPPRLRNDYDSALTKLRDRLGDEDFAREWSEGQEAHLDSIVDGCD